MRSGWIAVLLVTTTVVPFLGAIPAGAQPGSVDLRPQRVFDSRELLRQSEVDAAPNLRAEPGEKNPKLAMLYSLLLPGLGEYYLGRTDRAKIFFVAEGAIWTSFAVFRIQGNHREDLYKEYAEINAGAGQRDDDDFYRTIGNFIASDGPFSANEAVRRQARALFPDNPDRRDEFLADNGYFGDDAWEWESEEFLARYKEMRTSSLDAFRRSNLSLGLLVANRLISVLDTGIIASRRSRDQKDQATLSWNVDAGRFGPGAKVTLSRSF